MLLQAPKVHHAVCVYKSMYKRYVHQTKRNLFFFTFSSIHSIYNTPNIRIIRAFQGIMLTHTDQLSPFSYIFFFSRPLQITNFFPSFYNFVKPIQLASHDNTQTVHFPPGLSLLCYRNAVYGCTFNEFFLSKNSPVHSF